MSTARSFVATRGRQTALFVVLALGVSYAIAAVLITHPAWRWLVQFLMWSPGVAALILQGLRREPPRAMGFTFSGAGPWVVAFVYPFAVIGACISLAYGIGFATGRDVIHYQPATVTQTIYGVAATGAALIPLRLAQNLVYAIPWLVLAVAYRFEWPERLGGGRHLVRGALWAGVFLGSARVWWVPPGFLGEELGWRGWLVRVWRDRPLAALAISAPVWAAFHLPLIVMMPPLHAVVPASSFLLAVAAQAAIMEALYLWSGSIWPPVIVHFTWNFWNPFFLGSQYGPSQSLFGGDVWLINGEGLLGLCVSGVITLALIAFWWRARPVPESAHVQPGLA